MVLNCGASYFIWYSVEETGIYSDTGGKLAIFHLLKDGT